MLLADVRDESAEDVRLILEPKSRNVDPAVLMESLFRQTDLEVRFALNMNVLDAGNVPRVMSLGEVLWAFLDHRHTVLLRRTRHRLARIGRRLEVLDGFFAAYLNLDMVIRIIREHDQPRPVLMRELAPSEVQAQALEQKPILTLDMARTMADACEAAQGRDRRDRRHVEVDRRSGRSPPPLRG